MRGLTHIAAAVAAACFCLTAAACAGTSNPTASGAGAETTQNTQTTTEQSASAAASTAITTSMSAATSASATTSAPASSSAPHTSLPDGYDPSRNASADIAAALKLAAADHKKVLIDFGADWCPDCRVLGKTFQNPAVTAVLDKDYHVVAVDVGNFDHNIAVAQRYLTLQTSGIPGLVVLKPDGSVSVATNDGSFSNARSMSAAQVMEFLNHWSS
jgi:thiol:disulfide interchange protein